VLLALFPWFIIQNLVLETREKLGLTLAMSLGAITGSIVIFRAFFQMNKIDNNNRRSPISTLTNIRHPWLTKSRLFSVHVHLQLPRPLHHHHRPTIPVLWLPPPAPYQVTVTTRPAPDVHSTSQFCTRNLGPFLSAADYVIRA
jgi:hypothetical protein